MSTRRALLLALAGLALPVALAFGVYVASAGSLSAVPEVLVQPPAKIARAAATTTRETTPTETAPAQTTTGSAPVDDDLPGKCRKPENRLDPDCDPRTAEEDDDSSGPGSGGDDRDGDSSGHGSGDDD